MSNFYHLDSLSDENVTFRIYVEGDISLNDKEFILDPSVFHHMLYESINQTEFSFYVPDTLLRLIQLSRESIQEQAFLLGFLQYWGQRTYKGLVPNWELFYENIQRMKIISLTEELLGEQREELSFYNESFVNHPYYISLSPPKNVLADTIGKIMTFSKKTGKKIISKSKRLLKSLGGKIAALQLPDRADNLVQAKQNFTGKLFNFKGGKAAKVFVGIVIGVAGAAVTGNHYLSAAGVIFACYDP